MHDFNGKKILLGVTGGIAAYKAISLLRELRQLGAEVQVVMTASATQFITPMTFQALSGRAVRTELFDLQSENAMGHIELARWADYLLIAPASANCLAKLAHGLADDLLSTLALVVNVPVILCPAMNHSMWSNAATRANCEILQQRGMVFVGPVEGEQACGEYGVGRFSEVPRMINALRLLPVVGLLTGFTVLITAGPTEEPIDPVRYISNYSSGKMGYALAEAASMAGAEVILITGPCALTPPEGVRVIHVDTAQAMHAAVMQTIRTDMIFIATAAVADYAVSEPAEQKIKKNAQTSLTLTLHKNPDSLSEVALGRRALYVVGFAAETEELIPNARRKLQHKQLDMLVANRVGKGLVFGEDESQVVVLTPTDEIPLALQHKVRLAGNLIAMIAAKLQNNQLLAAGATHELFNSN
jgi:phosphopantothenoylcysteine decarboxylase/phosphopantothenate--cysteine ligase